MAADAAPPAPVCDAARHATRVAELDRIWNEDQGDRSATGVAPSTAQRDEERRRRVKAIADEGCLIDVHDLNVGWLVFQHGTTRGDHKLALDYAQRALALRDEPDTRLHVAMAADGWLVANKKKQLFGTQAQRVADAGRCACLVPAEPEFPDDERVKYTNKTLADQREWAVSLSGGVACGPVDCDLKLAPVAKGALPGVW